MINDPAISHFIYVIIKNSVVLGFATGMIGVFITTKENNIFSGSVANASLAGILISVVILKFKADIMLLIPAVIFAILTLSVIRWISRTLNINRLVLKSLIASVTFGLCMMLFSYLRHENIHLSSEFDKFILGDATTLLKDEATIVFYISLISSLIILLFLTRFKAVLFQPELALSSKIPAKFYELLIFIVTLSVTIAGIQIVGIIFIPVLFLIPAIIARLLTKTFFITVVFSGLIGALSAGTGSIISSTIRNISTGPAVIFIAGIIFLISILFHLIKNKKHYSYTLVRGKNDSNL